MCRDAAEHLVHFLGGVDSFDLVHVREQVDNRHGRIAVGVETLLQRFRVVVATTGSLSAFQDATAAGVLVTVEEENSLQIGAIAHFFDPAVEVVLVSWKAVDQETVASATVTLCFHGLSYQRTCNFHRYDKSFLNVVLDELLILRFIGSVLFGTKKVAS